MRFALLGIALVVLASPIARPVEAQAPGPGWNRLTVPGWNPTIEIDTTRTVRTIDSVDTWVRWTYAPPITADSTSLVASVLRHIVVDCSGMRSADLEVTDYGPAGEVTRTVRPGPRPPPMTDVAPDSPAEATAIGVCKWTLAR